MDSAELYAWLVEATLAVSAALLLVLALRKPLRAAFGANACHAAWSAVPVALLATWLPAAEADAPVAPMAVIRAPIQMLVAEAPRDAMPDVAALACTAWMGGCLAFAALLAWQQYRFVRGLGAIADRGDGVLLAESVAGLPAVLGVWKPRIVMPADALSRYDEAERGLMLAHEREHVARGDVLANAFVAVLRCLFWFNPLLHFAARRFRDDQELACDERVIARHPQSRRAYGEAMLKTQIAASTLPLGCHWGQSHPLKERIEMLKRPLPSSLRRAGGRALVIAILLASGYAAWAAQPAELRAVPALPGAENADYTARIEFSRDGGPPARFFASKRFGETFTMVDGDAQGRPSVTATVQPVMHDGVLAYSIAMRIELAGKTLSEPRIVVRDGKPASVQQGSERDGRFEGIRLEATISARDPAEALKQTKSSAKQTIAPATQASPVLTDRMPPPVYPVDVLKHGVSGAVVLIVDVEADGSVSAAKVDRSAGNESLDAAALDAVKQWKFKPAVKDGKPVVSQVRVPVSFESESRQDAKPTQPAAASMKTAGAARWGSYENMVASLRTSWQPPAAPQGDDC